MRNLTTASGILELIDPVDPENINPVRAHPGWWVLSWFEPVPPMDLVNLEHTPGIEIVKQERIKNDSGRYWVYVTIRVDPWEVLPND